MISEHKIKYWIIYKEKLDKAKALELELRKEICEHILQGKIKGSAKMVFGAYSATATAKLNMNIDAELLESIWKELSEKEKACIKYKPSLIAAEYKKLKEQQILNRCIDSKPGTPSLAIKPI